MSLKGLFKAANNRLEGSDDTFPLQDQLPQKTVVCKRCGNVITEYNFKSNIDVCLKCGYHHRISARTRLQFVCDHSSFEEFDADMTSKNPISFPGYEEKIASARQKSGENESVITGKGKLYGIECCFFFMEPEFMMASMGTVTGEKITRLFEFATQNSLPVVGFIASGGARMQEGMFSLMQMAKVSAAVKRHSDGGNLYVAVLTNPTTGGVTASFAMQGDVILSEPEALIGFAGPRVIEQTIKQKLPENFQSAEYVLKCGFLDAIVPRQAHRTYLRKLFILHGYKEVAESGRI